MTLTTEIEVKGLDFYYNGDAQALQNISLPIYKNKVTALIGPSGCGKTTLLRCFNRMHDLYPKHRYEGELLFQDKNILANDIDLINLRSRIGMVFQKPTPFPMSIAENIGLLSGPRGASARAQRLIAAYNIRAESPRQRAGSLSGGNQQKVLLARELDRNPEVIVAAEPTRGLDVEATRFVHQQLRAAADRGTAILLMTSDLDEAFALAGALHVIYRGTLSERLNPTDAAARAGRLMAGLE